MRLFHKTKNQNAESILRDGFRDSEVVEAGLLATSKSGTLS